MIATNELLAIGLSIIADFTNAVPIADKDVPRTPSDLQMYVVGSPNSPTDLHMTTRSGVQFGIRDGAVYYFCTQDSFFHEQNPHNLARYAGTSKMTSNQALQACSNILQRLTKRNVSLSEGVPRIHEGGVFQGKPIPFFLVEWPKISLLSHVNAADIEVDGRTGRLVFLHLLDNAFFDYAVGERIRGQVDRPKPTAKPAPP
jgi:hypothetical protein